MKCRICCCLLQAVQERCAPPLVQLRWEISYLFILELHRPHSCIVRTSGDQVRDGPFLDFHIVAVILCPRTSQPVGSQPASEQSRKEDTHMFCRTTSDITQHSGPSKCRQGKRALSDSPLGNRCCAWAFRFLGLWPSSQEASASPSK